MKGSGITVHIRSTTYLAKNQKCAQICLIQLLVLLHGTCKPPKVNHHAHACTHAKTYKIHVTSNRSLTITGLHNNNNNNIISMYCFLYMQNKTNYNKILIVYNNVAIAVRIFCNTFSVFID